MLRKRNVTVQNDDKVVVIWIDWYPYHVARFQALANHELLRTRMVGIELVGGAGVHTELVFREQRSESLRIITLAPEASWHQISQARLAVELWRQLQRVNPGAVFIPGYYTAPSLVAALWCLMRRRLAVLMSESAQIDHRRTKWKEQVKRLLLSLLFDWAIAGGKAQVRYLSALGFGRDRVARNYDVVDNHFYSKNADGLRAVGQPRIWNLPDKYFLYVGRLAPEKNVEELIREFGSYREAGGSWSLIIAGDGPLRDVLSELVSTLHLKEFVSLIGQKSSTGLVPYYAFAQCFVLPSIQEPWGLVVNEAMAAGLPVIVSDRCGCADDLVEPGLNGFIFSPQKTGSLAGCLLSIERQRTFSLVEMGRHSRRLIDRFSPETWAGEVARIVTAQTAEAS